MRKNFNRIKKPLDAITYAGGLFGAFLAAYGLYSIITSEDIYKYSDDHILITYPKVEKFRKFLDEHDGDKIYLKADVAMDAATDFNRLAHQVCDYGDFLDSTRTSSKQNIIYEIGFLELKPGFSPPTPRTYYYDDTAEKLVFEPETANNIRCYDTLRIMMLDSRDIRLSHGGTGTIMFPISGTFLVQKRYFSMKTEYTLRQISIN